VALALNKASVPTFMLDGYRPRELGSTPDKEAIAVRVGHHCPSILRRCRLESAVRASLALDNTHDELDLLVAVLRRLAPEDGYVANAHQGTSGHRRRRNV
jgi:cysteine desulfurase/selenocysteine lyase